MSQMSEIATTLQLDWTETWFGYQHNHSDYYIVFEEGVPLDAVLESKAWPHPIKTGELAWLVHYVSENEGFTWYRELDVEPDDDDDIRAGVFIAGIAAIAVGAALWALIILAVWALLN